MSDNGPIVITTNLELKVIPPIEAGNVDPFGTLNWDEHFTKHCPEFPSFDCYPKVLSLENISIVIIHGGGESQTQAWDVIGDYVAKYLSLSRDELLDFDNECCFYRGIGGIILLYTSDLKRHQAQFAEHLEERKHWGLFALTANGEFKRLPPVITDDGIYDYHWDHLIDTAFGKDHEDFFHCDSKYHVICGKGDLAMIVIHPKTIEVEDDDCPLADICPAQSVVDFVNKWVQLGERDGVDPDDCSMLEFGGIIFTSLSHRFSDGLETELKYANFSRKELLLWERRFENGGKEEKDEDEPTTKKRKVDV